MRPRTAIGERCGLESGATGSEFSYWLLQANVQEGDAWAFNVILCVEFWWKPQNQCFRGGRPGIGCAVSVGEKAVEMRKAVGREACLKIST